jgi:hypothetical protein
MVCQRGPLFWCLATNPPGNFTRAKRTRMGTVLEIVVLLLILASFFLAYMGCKTWPIYQVVLVWFVFAASVGFVYMGARTLKTHQSWRSAALAWQKAVDEVQKENVLLQEGIENGAEIVEPGIEQLEAELHRAVVDRGTVWFRAKVDRIDPKTGVGELTIEKPEPHDIVTKMVLFIFDQQGVAEGGKYLGEFKVTKGDGVAKTIEIAPNLPLTDQDRQRLAQAKDLWALYAVMPVDNSRLYAGMTDAERRALFPGKSPEGLAEYASADRTLRDYEYFFHQNAAERELLAASIATTQHNLQRIASAQQEVEKEIQFRQAERVALTADREKFQFEQKAIHTYLEALEKKLVDVGAQLQASFTATVQAAKNIEQIQLKAAEEIDRLTNEQAVLAPAGPAARPAVQ